MKCSSVFRFGRVRVRGSGAGLRGLGEGSSAGRVQVWGRDGEGFRCKPVMFVVMFYETFIFVVLIKNGPVKDMLLADFSTGISAEISCDAHSVPHSGLHFPPFNWVQPIFIPNLISQYKSFRTKL